MDRQSFLDLHGVGGRERHNERRRGFACAIRPSFFNSPDRCHELQCPCARQHDAGSFPQLGAHARQEHVHHWEVVQLQQVDRNVVRQSEERSCVGCRPVRQPRCGCHVAASRRGNHGAVPLSNHAGALDVPGSREQRHGRLPRHLHLGLQEPGRAHADDAVGPRAPYVEPSRAALVGEVDLVRLGTRRDKAAGVVDGPGQPRGRRSHERRDVGRQRDQAVVQIRFAGPGGFRGVLEAGWAAGNVEGQQVLPAWHPAGVLHGACRKGAGYEPQVVEQVVGRHRRPAKAHSVQWPVVPLQRRVEGT
mmetsp:Transcript_67525/g.206794  ORF Transcript_67525/g.206794 Transcript_67525/m.206794 type:complete len:304 (+) Transcript_67525:472-1383(+)